MFSAFYFFSFQFLIGGVGLHQWIINVIMIFQLADCEIDGIKGPMNVILTIQSTQIIFMLHRNSLNRHHHKELTVVILSLTNKPGRKAVTVLHYRVVPSEYLFPEHSLSAVSLPYRSIWCLTPLLRNQRLVLQWIEKMCLVQLVCMVPTHLQLQCWQKCLVIMSKVHAYHPQQSGMEVHVIVLHWVFHLRQNSLNPVFQPPE